MIGKGFIILVSVIELGAVVALGDYVSWSVVSALVVKSATIIMNE